MKIDENSYYWQRNYSYLLSDLRNSNEIFRKDATYDHIKSHKDVRDPTLNTILKYRNHLSILAILDHIGDTKSGLDLAFSHIIEEDVIK